jgi:cytidine deaminase
MEVVLANMKGDVQQLKVKDLLPGAFSPSDLKK